MKRLVREIQLKDSSQGLRRERSGSGINSHSEVLLSLFRAGWRALWLSIIIGGVYLDTTVFDIKKI